MTQNSLIHNYLAGNVTDNDFAKEYFPFICKIAKVIGSKFNYDKDDLAQDLWGLFVTKIIPAYDSSLSLEPFVYAFAKRHCLHLKGLNREINFSSMNSFPQPDVIEDEFYYAGLDESHTYAMDEEAIFSRIKGEKLLSKSMIDLELLAKLPALSEELARPMGTTEDLANLLARLGVCNNLSPQLILALIDDLQKLRKTINHETPLLKSTLPEDHQKLRFTRLKMGRTKPQFAKELGIQLATLDAYEYGRTKTVPPAVMEKAKVLAENFTDIFAGARGKFNSLTMSQIVTKWAEDMNIPVSDADKLAALLGTTRTTIKRWLTNESRADIEKLASLNEMIERHAKNDLMRV